jgi:hypothetical protein
MARQSQSSVLGLAKTADVETATLCKRALSMWMQQFPEDDKTP